MDRLCRPCSRHQAEPVRPGIAGHVALSEGGLAAGAEGLTCRGFRKIVRGLWVLHILPVAVGQDADDLLGDGLHRQPCDVHLCDLFLSVELLHFLNLCKDLVHVHVILQGAPSLDLPEPACLPCHPVRTMRGQDVRLDGEPEAAAPFDEGECIRHHHARADGVVGHPVAQCGHVHGEWGLAHPRNTHEQAVRLAPALWLGSVIVADGVVDRL
mmetsp:Transcript_27483/g.49514  ORF Transcript_27483/g.49514 Transcript_27483/m.49514 type:complete len:212 (+) Transcript_27483:807-1442(+)